MTQIHAETIVPAPPVVVWRTITAHERWADWCRTTGDAAGGHGGPRLTAVEVLSGPAAAVGSRRRCTAAMDAVPLLRLLGKKQAVWIEDVTDVRYPYTIEVEARGARQALRRWRVRLTLVQQADGHTRLHGRASYAPRGAAWLIDRLFLRRAIAASLRDALENLAREFEPAALDTAALDTAALDTAALDTAALDGAGLDAAG